MAKTVFVKACIFAGFIIFSSLVQASDLERRQVELKSIQSQINQQQSTLKSTKSHRKQLRALLKKDEQAIAKIAKKIDDIRQELSFIDNELTELKQKQITLSTQKTIQQAKLAKQLTSAYLTGEHDYTKMLLNQQNPAKVERMLVYYQYLNNARINAIKTVKSIIEELQSVTQKELVRKNELNLLMAEQQKQVSQLNKEQMQREKTLLQLQKTFTTKIAKLEQLQIEEINIKKIIKQALLQPSTPQMRGLNIYKHKLAWPTKGKLIEPFGSQRAAGLNWKGVLISAPEGQAIQTIAAGKVIYADWLKGFGMVMVIDHGKGYMSLYGHAQALLKPVGSIVKMGENIALVGRSGGQILPALYFEVRYKGQAVNPAKFCHK